MPRSLPGRTDHNLDSRSARCRWVAVIAGLGALLVESSPAAAGNAANTANGTCLLALERSTVVNRARHAPGSTADFTEIISTKSTGSAVAVRWKTSVFYAGGAMKPILWGTCLVTEDGKKVKSISYGK
jgi:hypothetical protein